MMPADENYEKPSRTKQWQERSERPTVTRSMTRDEMEEHRQNLAASYRCDIEDISYDFQKIADTNDEDRDECLWLKYRMKCVIKGKPSIRDIHTLKIPLPERIRKQGEQMRQQRAAGENHAQTLALPAPPPMQDTPKLRKPVLRKPS